MWIVATISSKFLAFSYFFDMAPRLFQKVESLTFQKMYGGICHLKWYRWPNFMDLAHGLMGKESRFASNNSAIVQTIIKDQLQGRHFRKIVYTYLYIYT